MLKFKKILPLVLVAILCIVSPALAVVTSTLGNYNTGGRLDNTYDIEITDDAFITFNAAFKSKYELVTTNDSIGATESGTTYVARFATASQGGTITLTLPTAVPGLEYSFIAGDDIYLYIDPADADVMIYGDNDAMQAGEQLKSAGNTADSVTIICPVANYWAIKAMKGTWTDGS